LNRKNFAVLYRDSKTLEESPLAEIFRIGYEELSRLNKFLDRMNADEMRMQPETADENVERAMRVRCWLKPSGWNVLSAAGHHRQHGPFHRIVWNRVGNHE